MTKFNPSSEQQTILGHDPRRHARVLAGPGTGKSVTLIALLSELTDRTPNLRVKLLTFTRAAAGELAKKVSAVPQARMGIPSTMHSFAISILLRNEGAGNFPRPLRIADDWENDRIVEATLSRRAGVRKNRISRLFRELASNWESLRPVEDPGVNPKDRAAFLAVWQEHRDISGYTLLAEIPRALLNAMRDHSDLEGTDLDLLVVDEYQDLNRCDLDLLQEFGRRGCSVVGVGDDDQSIYSFRRAAPEGIRQFLDDYANAAEYTLSMSLRCSPRILEWACWVIEADPDRPKDRPALRASAGAPEGEVALLAFANNVTEARGIARLVKCLHERDGLAYKDILILLRGDHHETFSTPIKAALGALGIPFSDPEAVKELLAEECNRRNLALYRLLVNPEDSLAWAALLELESGIGDQFVDGVYGYCRMHRKRFGRALLSLDTWAGSEFPGRLQPVAARARGMVDRVLKWCDGKAPLLDKEAEVTWGELLPSLSDGALAPYTTDGFNVLLRSIDDLLQPDIKLEQYLNQVTPLGQDIALNQESGVRIMTMTKSKGLTVRATIVGAVEDAIIPRESAELAEERRLLYVAMTRSTEYLYCTWARRRTGPTARSGAGGVQTVRSICRFLVYGPVASQDGDSFLASRLPVTAV